MSHAVGNKIVEINNEFEKFTSDIQFLVDEVKEDVQKTLDKFKELQSSLTERVDKIEDTVQNEVQQLKGLVRDLDQQFETFKQQASNIVEQSLTFSNFSPEKLREELINGIRMLGDRVSKAIEDINERIDNFTNEIQGKFNNIVENSYAREQGASNQEDEDFASLKESKLLDVNDYEIVPREAIKRLTELFKKQSSAVKNFIGNHEQKILEFEQLLKTYDNENTHLLDLLDRRVKRNFLISIVAIIIVILCSVAMRIF